MLSCSKNEVILVQWETNLRVNLKHNSEVCEKHFDFNNIQRQIIKDHNGNIIFSVRIKILNTFLAQHNYY